MSIGINLIIPRFCYKIASSYYRSCQNGKGLLKDKVKINITKSPAKMEATLLPPSLSYIVSKGFHANKRQPKCLDSLVQVNLLNIIPPSSQMAVSVRKHISNKTGKA